MGSIFLVLSSLLMFIDNWCGFVLQCMLLGIAIYLFSDIWFPMLKRVLRLKGR